MLLKMPQAQRHKHNWPWEKQVSQPCVQALVAYRVYSRQTTNAIRYQQPWLDHKHSINRTWHSNRLSLVEQVILVQHVKHLLVNNWQDRIKPYKPKQPQTYKAKLLVSEWVWAPHWHNWVKVVLDKHLVRLVNRYQHQ